MQFFAAVAPRPCELGTPGPGDDVVPDAQVVMDRAFTLPVSPDLAWPWIVQLGKDRAGWYLPRAVERLVPRARRAARTVDPRWQDLAVGDVVPDYGGPRETFEVVTIAPPSTLVYRSTRGRTELSWAITLRPDDGAATGTAAETVAGTGAGATRVHLRLRLGPVRHVRLAETLGGGFDLLTIAGMAAGLRERLIDQQRKQQQERANGS